MLASGFGHVSPKWVLHIANRPDLPEFHHDDFRVLAEGEVASIIQNTSNHWRKVFSIMAKISFALYDTGCESWQQYRDTKLLTGAGFEALNYLHYAEEGADNYFSIVAGFQYAATQLNLDKLITHQSTSKLLRIEGRDCIVTPYFDWRQLNNELLDKLIGVMSSSMLKNTVDK
ncbi:DUF6942 family protein [Psychrosphaera algicola]|uniref:Uncharacterized protein n=1 Tax=Psychrosphaera algicola TaxID=3023714 RepID=A0ABT5FDD7_9GAMM|nr:hypothetical protein [Psychrosphaera sp. G1-22]MDC2889523.1 hypothetical protein [Psychrosphaera sp. G1-22]